MICDGGDMISFDFLTKQTNNKIPRTGPRRWLWGYDGNDKKLQKLCCDDGGRAYFCIWFTPEHMLTKVSITSWIYEKKEKLTEFLSLNSVDWRMFFPSKNSMWVQIQRYFSIVLLFLNSRQVEEGKGKQRDNQSQKTKHCFILGKVIIFTTYFQSAMEGPSLKI